ncbi:hypothetical protein CSUI_009454, partial [Cystoisospora suis]
GKRERNGWGEGVCLQGFRWCVVLFLVNEGLRKKDKRLLCLADSCRTCEDIRTLSERNESSLFIILFFYSVCLHFLYIYICI